MAFNNGLKRKQFEARWTRLREEYAASGMDESTIAALYEFDRQTFNSNRRYAEHTQVLCNQGAFDDGDEGGEDKSTMLLKFFDSLTTEIYDEYQPKENGWVNEIESESLWKGVSQLSDADRELLTLYAFQEYSITEIAQIQGVSRPTVSKKLTRIRHFLQKFLPMATK